MDFHSSDDGKVDDLLPLIEEIILFYIQRNVVLLHDSWISCATPTLTFNANIRFSFNGPSTFVTSFHFMYHEEVLDFTRLVILQEPSSSELLRTIF